jgi:oligopeptide transport system ATP-binding protein
MAKNKKLEVDNLTVSFRTTQGMVRAVRGVSFDLYQGETLAIVGESGSGKSVSSRTIMGILAGNGVIDRGSIIYDGEDLTKVDEEHFHEIRGNKIGMIFQDPMSSLNPIMRIGRQITEGMLLNGKRLDNRYKELFNRERITLNRLLRDKKNLKKELKVAVKEAKLGHIEELPELNDQITSLEHDIQGFKRDISSNNSTISNKNTKLTRQERAEKVATLKAENADLAVKVKDAEAKIAQILADNQDKINAYISELQAKLTEQLADVNSKIPEAKSQLGIKKAEAKQIVNQELLAEKERINGLIAKVLEEEANDMPNLQAKAAEIQGKADEIKAKIASLQAAFKEESASLDKDIVVVKRRELNATVKALRGEVKALLQEKRAVLNTYKVQVADLKEELARFTKVTKREAYERAIQVMEEVGIPEPHKRFRQYPFQFSGGMRQRIVIAIALTASPDVLICDEPTTALDVTIQAQILELINDLKKERNLSVIFITHDLGVVANMADRIAVMYAGKIVELGTAEDVFYDPRHPYTWALLSSMPDLDSKERLTAIPGTPPNMLFPPIGDAFAERNSYAMKIDFEKQPPMFKVSETHSAATWLLHPNAPKVEMPAIIQARINRMTSDQEEAN